VIEQVKVHGSTLGPRKLYGRWLLKCRNISRFLIIVGLIKGIRVPWRWYMHVFSCRVVYLVQQGKVTGILLYLFMH